MFCDFGIKMLKAWTPVSKTLGSCCLLIYSEIVQNTLYRSFYVNEIFDQSSEITLIWPSNQLFKCFESDDVLPLKNTHTQAHTLHTPHKLRKFR